MCLNAGAMGRQDAESETLIPTFGGVFDVGITLLGGGHSNNPLDENIIPVPFDTTQITSLENRSNPQPGDPCHPLASSAHAPAIAFPARLSGTQCASAENLSPSLCARNPTAVAIPAQPEAVRDVAQTITSNYGKQVDNSDTSLGPNVVIQRAVVTTLAIRGRGDSHNLEYRTDGTANTLLTPNGGRAGIGVGAIQYGPSVRRLTPRECERLQGFADDYTAIEWRGKPADQCPDGTRYKALGNSMAVPVMRWIGKRIAAVDQTLEKSA